MAAVLAASLLALAVATKPAEAAFPGSNGKIAFYSDRTTGAGVDNPTGDNEIFTRNPDGTGLTQLTFNTAFDLAPALSPDGTRIAFTSQRDGNNEIYVMDADGSNQMRLTHTAESDYQATWSPDGNKIAFTRFNATSTSSQIFVTNADGSGTATDLTNGSTSLNLDANWSPTQNKIAFTTNRDGNNEIYVMDTDPATNDAANLSNNAAQDKAPSYSPDGTRIAFTSTRARGYDDLHAMDTDPATDDAVRISNDGYVDEQPAYSPDGQKIAFGSYASGHNQIFVRNADGSGTETNITNDSTVVESNPLDWGPLPVDLSITQSDSPDPAKVDRNLTYSLTVTNAGSAATGVVITDRLPSGVTFLSASPGCASSGGTVTCNVGGLARGATATKSVAVSPTTAGTITNTVSVTSTSRELSTADNSDKEHTEVFDNRAPVANSDGYATDEDTSLTVDAPGVLADDTDADGDLLTATVVAAPSNGVLTLDSNGSFTYVPDANFEGGDEFTYKAYDGTSDSNVATVTIRVRAVNDSPYAQPDTAQTEKDTPVDIDVLANDSDPDGDALGIIGVNSPPAHGVTARTAGGEIQYGPDPGYIGPDSFTYIVADGNGGIWEATVDVSVEDTVAPTVSATTSRKRGANVKVSFSEPMNHATLMDSTSDPVSQPSLSRTIVLLRGTSTSTVKVPAKASCTDSTCQTVVLNPDVRLGAGKKYTVKVEGDTDIEAVEDSLAVEDLAANRLAQDFVKSFKTGTS